jgi:zinc transporter 11
MLAASYWSLLAPAVELADSSGLYGAFTFLPIALGFTGGAVFVYTADLLLPLLGVCGSNRVGSTRQERVVSEVGGGGGSSSSSRMRADSASSVEEGDTGEWDDHHSSDSNNTLRSRARRSINPNSLPSSFLKPDKLDDPPTMEEQTSWRRILLLIIAITVHNIPGMHDCGSLSYNYLEPLYMYVHNQTVHNKVIASLACIPHN